jgi:hypothetical protein
MIALVALKYFILKVDPKKTMMFNPEESIDFNGIQGLSFSILMQDKERVRKHLMLEWVGIAKRTILCSEPKRLS